MDLFSGIGLLELNTCCKCCVRAGLFSLGRFAFVCCCIPSSSSGPKGQEWNAAAPGFASHILDAEEIAASVRKHGCCGCFDSLEVKTALDREWVNKANTYLRNYNLRAETLCWDTRHGESIDVSVVDAVVMMIFGCPCSSNSRTQPMAISCSFTATHIGIQIFKIDARSSAHAFSPIGASKH